MQLFHTEQLLHRRFYTEAFAQGSLCTDQLLHTKVFTQRSLYTEQLLHTEVFTQESPYTDHLSHKGALHRDAFTQRSLYTETLLHTDTFSNFPLHLHIHLILMLAFSLTCPSFSGLHPALSTVCVCVRVERLNRRKTSLAAYAYFFIHILEQGITGVPGGSGPV